MKQITQISVNGEVYSIGGSSDDSYIIPKAVSEVTNSSELINAFGGNDAYNEFLSAVSSRKNFYIQLDGILLPANVVYSASTYSISWYTYQTTLKKMGGVHLYFLVIGASILTAVRQVFEFSQDNVIKVNIYNLTESSSSEDIKTALTENWDADKVKEYGARQFYKNLQGVSSNAELGVTLEHSGEIYTYNISCNLKGCFEKSKGGIITIEYNESSDTYSVTGIEAF